MARWPGRTPRGRVGAGIAVVLLVTLLSAGCGVRGLHFVQDDRLEIVTPADRAEVSLPVEIRWRFHADSMDHTDVQFALLVDRTPQPPRQDLRWYLDDERDCPRDDRACPSREYLATRSVYMTGDTGVVLDAIAPRVGVARGLEHTHDVVVILLDGHGRRLGETAARVTLRVVPAGGR